MSEDLVEAKVLTRPSVPVTVLTPRPGDRDDDCPRIEPAVPGDLDRLVAIENAAFDPALYKPMSRRQFRFHLASERTILLVARDATGTAMGYALGLCSRATNYVRFYSLAVDPHTQGGRVGAALFPALEEAARMRGSRGVQCEIRADNAKLLSRYIALGYVPYRRVADFYPDGASCIKMKRDFSPLGSAQIR